MVPGMAETDPLTELLDEGRVTEVRSARLRERVLRRMAEEGAQLAGTLVDLAERESRVTMGTVAGRHHHGVVVRVGGDYCVLRSGSGAAIHLCLNAITTVRPSPGERHVVASGEPRSAMDLLLLEVLGRAAGDRRRVSLVTRTGEVVSGDLLAVGVDVLSLSLAGGAGDVCYIAASALSEARFDD